MVHVIYLLYQFSKIFSDNTSQQIVFVNLVIQKLLHIQYNTMKGITMQQTSKHQNKQKQRDRQNK